MEPDQEKELVSANKAGRSWTIRHGDAECGGYLAGVGLAFVQYLLTMTFWKGNVYNVMLGVCGLLLDFDFLWDYS